ncbi:glycosyltransferase family 4 protein [Clostridium coskatii]|uniref:Alpha-galactosylglucosyldiacylglycerol synthase n=1 Tax=Clostridium coskatii TaxID=1705578 RepID=A0A166UQ89_9CLOT|nr:glycosyltransferase family 4 protein [Clostridium coskatii]OAA95126.1 Alpha-galactosylglucosyldiacylglycerol synthase [Clostridium coskatii]OBR97526.1 alpha-galactosylglucosyldiacylglycerol synthase [Clostridium coskatii]
MPVINMLSSAEQVKGQGVLSAYVEQVNLVRNELKDSYEVRINDFKLCDIMHYHTIDFKFFLSIPFAKLLGTSVAYVHFVPETIDNSLKLPYIIKKIFYKYIILFYKSVDYLVVVNPYFIDVLKKYNIEEEKIVYIPNFVSENNFFEYEKEKAKKIKQELRIPLKKFVVLGVGQVQNRKGILDFIEVAKKLPQIQFIWAGGFSFGVITDGYKKLKKVVENPPENVRFLGIIDRKNMNDIYNIADIMFLPSYNELFPMSVLEAMALKIPVLLRDLDIYHNILFDDYLKGKNIDEFVKCIERLQDKGESYRTWCERSWKCHKFYSKEYILNTWKQFYDKIYYEKNKRRKLKGNLNEK